MGVVRLGAQKVDRVVLRAFNHNLILDRVTSLNISSPKHVFDKAFMGVLSIFRVSFIILLVL